jgi:hypothetical protein
MSFPIIFGRKVKIAFIILLAVGLFTYTLYHSEPTTYAVKNIIIWLAK